MLNKSNNVEKNKEKKLHSKKEKQEKRLKKWKAKVIEQEKDPQEKTKLLKMAPEEIDKYLSQKLKEERTNKRLNSATKYQDKLIDKEVLSKIHNNNKLRFQYRQYMNNKSFLFNYFWGVGKERRRIRWISKEDLKIDTRQTIIFIIIFACIFMVLDLLISLLKYWHVLK